MSARLSTLILLLIVMHLVLSGCQGNSTSDEQGSTEFVTKAGKTAPSAPPKIQVPNDTVTPPPNTPSSDWLPQQFSLTCALTNCPIQVGALLFVTPTTATGSSIRRCTAFLIDSDKIMTNGHCDFSESSEGYFFTRTDAPERTVRRISRRIFKDFTPGKDKKRSSGRPDYTIFQLETPITNIQPLTLARGQAKIYQSLTAIVVNAVPGKDATTLTIGQINCVIHRHEQLFPFDLAERPDTLTLFGCSAEEGNSGSPMFAPGSLEVEAVLQATADLEGTAKKIRADLHREPFPFEMQPNVVANNVRCLNYPAKVSGCFEASEEKLLERFNQLLLATAKGVDQRTPPGGPYQTEFTAMSYNLKDSREGEVMYNPKCRTVGTVTNFVIPSERISIAYDDWGKPSIKSNDLQVSTARILFQDPGQIQVTMNWVKPFGEFNKPEVDLRKQLGQTFSIALPPCPR